MTTAAAKSETRSAAGRPGWWGARFGGLPRQFWLLFTGVGLARLGFFVVPFMSFWLVTDRGLSLAESGIVLMAFGVGWTVSMPLGGWLADRLGRKAVIVAGAVGAAGAYILLGSVRGYGQLVAGALVVGATFDLYRPAVQAAMTDAVEPRHRGRALGLLYLVMNASRMVACVLGGLLAGRAFGLLFVANAVINLAFALIVYRAVRDDTGKRPHLAAAITIRATVRDRHLAVFSLITLVFYSIHMQSMVALPVVLADAGATAVEYGLLLALDPLIVVIVQLLAQQWINRTPALVVCAIGVVTVGGGLALTGLAPSLGWMAATIPIWVIGEVAFLTASPGVVAAIAPDHLRALYFGVWGATLGLSAVIAPLLASVLDRAGLADLLWFGGAAAGAVTAAACLALRRRLPAPAST